MNKQQKAELICKLYEENYLNQLETQGLTDTPVARAGFYGATINSLKAKPLSNIFIHNRVRDYFNKKREEATLEAVVFLELVRRGKIEDPNEGK